MMDERSRRGLESLVAAFLREHVAPALFERDEVRRGLGPEGLERVRREVLARLEEAERRGMEDRARAREVLRGWMGGAAGEPGLAALLALVRSWLPSEPSSRRSPG